MTPLPVALAVAATPISAAAASPALDGDLLGALWQLGIGGVLVGFGSVIYSRFEKRADAAAVEHRAEITVLNEKHETELRAEREAHEQTRQRLITAIANKENRT